MKKMYAMKYNKSTFLVLLQYLRCTNFLALICCEGKVMNFKLLTLIRLRVFSN